MVLIFILKYLSDFHCKTGRAVNVCYWSQQTLSSKVTKIEKSPYLAGWPAAWSLEGIMLPAHTVCWHVIPLDPKSTWPIYIWEGETRYRLALPHLATLDSRAGTKRGASAQRAADQASQCGATPGCIFEAGNSFTTQSNLNRCGVKMQITRLFWCWCYRESQ